MTPTNGYSPVQQAEGKIKLATARLAYRYPFHAKVLEQFKVISMPAVATMGVTIRDGDLLLAHFPDFVLETSADELAGVLHHEVNHVILGHVLADPAEFPDSWARVIAEEVTVNEFVPEPLPGNPILLKQYPMLPPLESTAERYRRLLKVKKRRPIAPPSALPSTAPGNSGPGSNSSQGNGRSANKKGAQAAPGQMVDNHDIWEIAREDPQTALTAIRGALQQAVLEAGTDSLPDTLRSALEALGIGTEAGNQQYRIQGGRQGQLDWRHLLRRYAGQVLQRRPVFNRPPRRFPDLVGIIPGQGHRSHAPLVMAVIDTSGSISDETLEMIDAELRRLSKSHAVTVVECDAEIHKVYKYRRLESLSGRGGTDLRPPFERAFLRKQHPDLVIYFTDGEGPAPEHPPRVPVFWCIVPGGIAPAAWGRVIWMDPNQGENENGAGKYRNRR